MAQGSIELEPEPWAAQSLKDGLQKLGLPWLSFDGLRLPGQAEHNTSGGMAGLAGGMDGWDGWMSWMDELAGGMDEWAALSLGSSLLSGSLLLVSSMSYLVSKNIN